MRLYLGASYFFIDLGGRGLYAEFAAPVRILSFYSLVCTIIFAINLSYRAILLKFAWLNRSILKQIVAGNLETI